MDDCNVEFVGRPLPRAGSDSSMDDCNSAISINRMPTEVCSDSSMDDCNTGGIGIR